MQEKDLKSGIYMITTNINEKFYIGSALNLNDRFNRHSNLLKRNKHQNVHLQNIWNKYKNCQLNFYILEKCSDILLIEREQFWIDNLKPLLNINPTAYSRKGIKLSNETKLKISLKLKGISHSIERRKSQSVGQIGRKATNRKIDKWPHERGRRCDCNECKQKKNNYLKEYWKTYERK